MDKIKRIIQINNLPIVLFVIILVNFLPIYLFNGFSKYVEEVPTIITCGSFVLEIIILGIYFFKKIKFQKNQIISLTMLICMVFIMGLVQLKNFLQNNFFIMDFFNIGCIFLNIFLLFICILNIEIDSNKIKKFLKLLLYLGIISMIWNVFLYFFEIIKKMGINFVGFNYGEYVKGFFANRNTYSFFLLVIMMVDILLMYIDEKKNIYKVLIPCIYFSIWSTSSKTGFIMVCIFLEMIIIFVSNFKLKKKLMYTSWLAIISFICLLNILEILPVSSLNFDLGFSNEKSQSSNEVIFNNVNEKSEAVSTKQLARISGRKEIWISGVKILVKSPLNIICGIGRFNSLEILEKDCSKAFTHFHNVYLDIFVTGGMVEFIYIVFIFVYVIKLILKSNTNIIIKKLYLIIYMIYFGYIFLESFGRFSVGGVDPLCIIFFVTIPILYSNSIKNSN